MADEVTSGPSDSEKVDGMSAFVYNRAKRSGYDSVDYNVMSSAMKLSAGLIEPEKVAPPPPKQPVSGSRSLRRAYERRRIIEEYRAKEAEALEAKLQQEDRSKGLVLDKDWLTNQIMIPSNELETKFKLQAYKSTAHFKFQDTTIGGHRACNAPPQFTRYCDIRANDLFYPWDPTLNSTTDTITMSPTGNPTTIQSNIRFNKTTAHTGMGRFYAQALDDGAQELYLQFGLPEFNGLAAFFMGAVTYTDAYISKHGTIPQVYTTLKPIVQFLTAIAMPGTFLMSFLLKATIGPLIGNRAYKYYYMKPNMHIFWSTVNQMVNEISIGMGILSPMFMPDDKLKPDAKFTDKSFPEQDGSKGRRSSLSGEQIAKDISSTYISEAGTLTQGRAMKFNSQMIDEINSQFGDGTIIFSSTTNYIDVYELVCRYQNRVNLFMKSGINEFVKMSNVTDVKLGTFQSLMYQLQGQKYTVLSKFEPFLYNGDLENIKQFQELNSKKLKELMAPSKNGFKAHMDDLVKSGAFPIGSGSEKQGYKHIKGANNSSGDGRNTGTAGDATGVGTYVSKISKKFVGDFKSFWQRRAKVFDANSRLANSQVMFLVQPTGATSESFSNSTGEIQSGGLIKSFGKAAHDMRFNFAGGKTGIGFIDAGIDAAIQAGHSIIDSVTWGFSDTIRGLTMGAYVDVPKIWEDSSAGFPSVTYTMDLVAPYGNAYSRLQNIVIPLSILLAGTLPLRVGKASYTSPFLCQAYCQGVHHIRLGMITDLSITRNGSNLQQTLDKQTNFVNVSFTITDLGSRIAAPINNSLFHPEGWFPMMDQDTPFGDYVTALSGRHFSEINWIWPSIGNNISNALKSLSGRISPTAFVGALANTLGNSPVTGWLFANPAIEADHNSL